MKTTTSRLQAKHLFPDQVIDVFEDFAVEVCLRKESKNTAFYLRYRAYRAVDGIPENQEELLRDDYDNLPNVRIFLVWHRGKPVATIRSCIYSDQYNWMPIESTKYFHETINRELGTGLRILESNRFAVDPDFQGRQSLFARFLLFRAHGLNAEAHGCSHIITSVRDSHRAFYLRFLGMPSLSEHPVYIPWVDTEGYLLANDIETCRKNFLKWGVPDYSQSDVRQFIQCAQLAISVRQSAA